MVFVPTLGKGNNMRKLLLVVGALAATGPALAQTPAPPPDAVLEMACVSPVQHARLAEEAKTTVTAINSGRQYAYGIVQVERTLGC